MKQVVVIPGQGVGPEIIEVVKSLLGVLHAPVELPVELLERENPFDAEGRFDHARFSQLVRDIREVGTAIKGPFPTPIAGGHESVNVQLRQELQLYANVRPVRSLPGISSPFQNLDLVIIRENLEGSYIGVEFRPVEAAERLHRSRIRADMGVTVNAASVSGSRRIAAYAFQYAEANHRKRVTVLHKANIEKITGGIFLRAAREIASAYPIIEYEELIADDALGMATEMLWKQPDRFDVLLCQNHTGDILSSAAAGMIGNRHIVPSAQFGKTGLPHYKRGRSTESPVAVFEAIHGTADALVGRGTANPTALLLSAVLMLRYLRFESHADRLEQAICCVLDEGEVRTPDLGGTATTKEFAAAIQDKLLS